MRIKGISFVTLLGSLLLAGCFSRSVNFYSPDKNICVTVNDSTMTVKYKKQVVQTVRLGDCYWAESSHIRETINERYTMLSGKRKKCSYVYRAMSCSESSGRNLLIRVSNAAAPEDGL